MFQIFKKNYNMFIVIFILLIIVILLLPRFSNNKQIESFKDATPDELCNSGWETGYCLDIRGKDVDKRAKDQKKTVLPLFSLAQGKNLSKELYEMQIQNYRDNYGNTEVAKQKCVTACCNTPGAYACEYICFDDQYANQLGNPGRPEKAKIRPSSGPREI